MPANASPASPQEPGSPSSSAPHELWRGVSETLRTDAVGGALLLGATLIALVLANTPAAALYTAVRDYTLGPERLHLHLSVGSWAADGLLAIFFFVVGLELKEELVAGSLRDPRAAAIPIAAALGGVAAPALVFVAVTSQAGNEALRGWAIPTATDIAFAIAVLAVIGKSLPAGVRVFLLTLAIVDDLVAITIIATFYTDHLNLLALALALIPLAAFALAVQRGIRQWWLLIPLAVITWALVHASGVHATVAGVLLGFTVPVAVKKRARIQVGRASDGHPIYDGLAAHFADRWGLISTTIAVPVFAFFSAGVTVGGASGLAASFTDPIALGIIAGLIIGKPLGILTVSMLLTRLPQLSLDSSIRWIDMLGMSFLAGIGFTVSLLVGELSYGVATGTDTHVKVGVLLGSVIAATVGAFILAARNRHYRQATDAHG